MSKKIAGKLHLWVGLLSAIPISIVCLTGAIYALRDEIQDLTEPWRFVAEETSTFLLPSEAISIACRKAADHTVYALTYGGKTDAIRVDVINPDKQFETLWLNPYSGKVLHTTIGKDPDFDFFGFILNGHRRLWLPPAIGRPIVGSSVLLFVIALLTGIIYRWPRIWNRKTMRRLFFIKRNAGKNRLIFDLHSVVGFYVALFLLLIAGTGLVWSFKWYSEGLYRLTGGKELKAYKLPESILPDTRQKKAPINRLYNTLRTEEPQAKEFYFVMPQQETEVYRVSIVHKKRSYYRTDNRFFDQYTLQELDGEGPYAGRYREVPLPDRIRRMNLEIHDGRIAGLPGRILVFFSALIGASLPVSGFWLWRKKKKGKFEKTTVRKPHELYVEKTPRLTKGQMVERRI